MSRDEAGLRARLKELAGRFRDEPRPGGYGEFFVGKEAGLREAADRLEAALQAQSGPPRPPGLRGLSLAAADGVFGLAGRAAFALGVLVSVLAGAAALVGLGILAGAACLWLAGHPLPFRSL